MRVRFSTMIARLMRESQFISVKRKGFESFAKLGAGYKNPVTKKNTANMIDILAK